MDSSLKISESFLAFHGPAGCTSMDAVVSIQTLQQLAVELRLYGAHGHVLPIWSLVGVIEGRPAVQHVLPPGAIPHTDAAWFPHKRAHISSSFNLEDENKHNIPLKMTFYFPLKSPSGSMCWWLPTVFTYSDLKPSLWCPEKRRQSVLKRSRSCCEWLNIHSTFNRIY